MIHVNINGSSPDRIWLARAESATCEILTAKDDEERKDVIERHSHLWAEIKAWLLSLSHGKCWYSEANEIYSIYDVDHFRPKLRAKDMNGATRQGYWWLAFEWTNYRVAGAIGNRANRDTSGDVRGKRDFFPLAPGCRPAVGPDDDLRDELPYLLDPTDPDDPLLLTFDETGQPAPRAAPDSWPFERARVTIDFLHLNYSPLVDARKKVWQDCRERIERAERLMGTAPDRMSVTKNADLRQEMSSLRHMVAPKAELSATAKECLLKSGRDWACRLATGA